MAFATDTARWRALVTRDVSANGQFVYSVKSTKIYCRPNCPGRLARRANVGFYEKAFQAEAAGFRACKRCKPDTVLEDPQERAVEKARIMIHEALKKDDPSTFKLQELAKKVGLTPRYFHKIFKDKIGMTPKDYAKSQSSTHSSPSTTSVTTDVGAQAWCWDDFDFNDVTSYGVGADQATFLNFDATLTQGPVVSHGAVLEGASTLEPWMADVWDDGLLAIGTDWATAPAQSPSSSNQSQCNFSLSIAEHIRNPISMVSASGLSTATVCSDEFSKIDFSLV